MCDPDLQREKADLIKALTTPGRNLMIMGVHHSGKKELFEEALKETNTVAEIISFDIPAAQKSGALQSLLYVEWPLALGISSQHSISSGKELAKQFLAIREGKPTILCIHSVENALWVKHPTHVFFLEFLFEVLYNNSVKVVLFSNLPLECVVSNNVRDPATFPTLEVVNIPPVKSDAWRAGV
jgi:hypothetical protein